MVHTVEFLGLGFHPLDQRETLDCIAALAAGDGFSYVVTPNVDHMVKLHEAGAAPELRNAYENADLRVCDSRILQALARRSGIKLPLVTGSDLTAALLQQANDRHWRIAVVGGDPALLRELEGRYPAVIWSLHQPPMGVRHDPDAQLAIARFVEQGGADIWLFAIGAPQSELMCAQIASRGKAGGVALCIGASLEFVTGAKSRAPLWMQRLSLEWLYRLASEPGRLWRRYLVQGPRIFTIWRRWNSSVIRPGGASGSTASDVS